MQSNDRDPELSVVVIVLTGSEALEKCLESLRRAPATLSKEVIIPCDRRLGSDRLLAERFPEVIIVPVSGVRTYAELRAIGVARSRGEVVALTEDHCIPDEGWCSEILRLHKAVPHAGIGGVVEKQIPDGALNWAFYFADYVRYMNPVPDGPTDHLTDCNVSYKKNALAQIAGTWAREFHENVVHAALRARGYQLYLSSRIIVRQRRDIKWPAALWDRYAFGRLFASTRIQTCGRLRRLMLAGTTLLLPAFLTARSAAHVFRKRSHRWQFARCLPQLALLALMWSVGELAGYVIGRPERMLSATGSPALDEPAGRAL